MQSRWAYLILVWAVFVYIFYYRHLIPKAIELLQYLGVLM